MLSFIRMFLYMAQSIVLNSMGYGPNKWQYWVLMMVPLCIALSVTVDKERE